VPDRLEILDILEFFEAIEQCILDDIVEYEPARPTEFIQSGLEPGIDPSTDWDRGHPISIS